LGFGVSLSDSRDPQFFETLMCRLMNGHVESTGEVVTASASASNEALLPQIGQSPTWFQGKLGY
jgi:hypothetical protein